MSHTIGVSLLKVEAGHARKTDNVIYGGGLGHLGSVDLETELDRSGNYDYVETLKI